MLLRSNKSSPVFFFCSPLISKAREIRHHDCSFNAWTLRCPLRCPKGAEHDLTGFEMRASLSDRVILCTLFVFPSPRFFVCLLFYAGTTAMGSDSRRRRSGSPTRPSRRSTATRCCRRSSAATSLRRTPRGNGERSKSKKNSYIQSGQQ